MPRYVAGHAAKDIHAAFYNHRVELVGELADEFEHMVRANEGLKDPTESNDVVPQAAQ
jgi:hypothetical protein